MSEYENKENRQRKRSNIIELNATKKKKQKLSKFSNGTNDLNDFKQLGKKLNQLKVKKVHKARTNTKQDKFGSRVCGNGKPMPSLTELEKLYDDSEEDHNYEPLSETQIQEQTQTPQNESTDYNDPVSIAENSEQCQAVSQDLLRLSKDILLSPTIIKRCAFKSMEYHEKVLESTNTNDNGPTLPVIPQKRAEKNDIPYIVGCKDRKQVEWRPQVNFCKGDGNYGAKPQSTINSNEELQTVKLKRSKKKSTTSNSIFNAKSVDFSQKFKLDEQYSKMLKSVFKTDNEEFLATSINYNVESVQLNSAEQDHKKIYHLNTKEYIKEHQKIDEVIVLSEESNDSVKTVYYDYNKLECEFSPKPSTSSDQETILENDKNFEKSLISQAKYLINKNENLIDKSSIAPNMNENEDQVVIIDENDKSKDSFSSGDTIVNDIYSSINIPFPIEMELDEFDNDYDKLLADNKAIIEKLNKQSLPCETIHDSYQIIKTKPQDNGINNSNLILLDTIDSNRNDFDIGKNLDIQDQRNGIMTFDFILESTNNLTVSHQLSPLITSQYSNQSFQPIVNKPFSCINLVSPNHVTTANILGNTIPALATTRKRTKKSKNTKKDNRSSSINNTLNIQPCLLNNTSWPSGPSHTTSKVQSPCAGRGSMRNIGDCPICMDSLSEKQVASTMCGHIFCLPCIKVALQTRSKKCPSCRKSLKGVGYHQLFL